MEMSVKQLRKLAAERKIEKRSLLKTKESLVRALFPNQYETTKSSTPEPKLLPIPEPESEKIPEPTRPSPPLTNKSKTQSKTHAPAATVYRLTGLNMELTFAQLAKCQQIQHQYYNPHTKTYNYEAIIKAVCGTSKR